MGVGAVLAELTFAFVDPELALLGFVVVVLYIHHLENELCWKWLKKNMVSIYYAYRRENK